MVERSTERGDPVSLSQVLAYLGYAEARFLRELELSREVLDRYVPGEWSISQIARHLIRTEQMMYPLWFLVPKIGRWPALCRNLDTINAGLWRLAGLKTLEAPASRIAPDNATDGRFEAPFFLTPSHRPVELVTILKSRNDVRTRTLRAIESIPEKDLLDLRWSHPVLGSFSLLGMIQFLGIHEEHHLPQIQRIRLRESGIALWRATAF
jgi:hypothetical protein